MLLKILDNVVSLGELLMLVITTAAALCVYDRSEKALDDLKELRKEADEARYDIKQLLGSSDEAKDERDCR